MSRSVVSRTANGVVLLRPPRDNDAIKSKGWSSPVATPYSPLGVPDLNIEVRQSRRKSKKTASNKNASSTVVYTPETYIRASKLAASLIKEFKPRKIPKCIDTTVYCTNDRKTAAATTTLNMQQTKDIGRDYKELKKNIKKANEVKRSVKCNSRNRIGK